MSNNSVLAVCCHFVGINILKLRGLDFYRNRRFHKVKDKITADLEL